MMNVPSRIRTYGLQLRRLLLYPAELLGHIMERVKGIEPSSSAWKAEVLPLNYTRINLCMISAPQLIHVLKTSDEFSGQELL